MEFFKEVSLSQDVEQLRDLLSIANLSKLCASIDRIIEDKIESGLIYCLWGEFAVNREIIKNGIRFSLPGCPNALAWSITKEEDLFGRVLIHCTINKSRHEPEFIESIQEFVNDWQIGLEKLNNGIA